MTTKETAEIVAKTLLAANECYDAFNELALKTRVTFDFYATDLYMAKKFLEAWIKEMRWED